MASKDEEMVVGDKSLENIYEKTKNEAFLDGHSVEDMNEWTLRQFGWYRGFINSSQMQETVSGAFFI